MFPMPSGKMAELKKEWGLLNENGKNLLEAKKVLLQNKNNPIVYNGIISYLKKEDYEKEVFEALIDNRVGEKTFESVLLHSPIYTNEDLVKQHLADFQTKLAKLLEQKGVKYFSTDISTKDISVLVIKKFGVNLDLIKREFRITHKEAEELLKDGFVKKYAQLRLNAFAKVLVEKVEKEFTPEPVVRLEISPFYYDETHNIFNIDFRIVIPVTETLLPFVSMFSPLVVKISEILEYAQKKYFQTFHSQL
jgi:hypothetical protein